MSYVANSSLFDTLYRISILLLLCLQSDLHEAKDDLTEKVQLLRARDAELKMLHKKLDDTERQVKDEQQRKEADQSSWQDGYHKVGHSLHYLCNFK